MKVQFVALVAATLASASLVAAGFLNASPHHSWQDYCTSNGVKKGEPHVCFESDVDLTQQFLPDASNFQGYFSASNPKSKSAELILELCRCRQKLT